MGSQASPLPTFGNPAGVTIPGMNPNYLTETFNGLNGFVPGGAPGTVPLGTAGITPFTPRNPTDSGGGGNPTPMPVLPPYTPPVSTSPQGGNPNALGNNPGGGTPATGTGGLTFGYPSVPGSVGNFNGGTSAPNVGNQITNSSGGGMNGRPVQFGYLYRNLGGIYGGGEIGRSLANFLNNGAGYNQDVVNTLINNMQPYVQQGLNSIAEMFGASGQRFGSTAALASGQTLATYLNQEQGLMAQMYMWSIQNMLSVLTGGKYQPQENQGLLGGIGKSLLGAAGAGIAGGISSGSAMGGILAGLAAL